MIATPPHAHEAQRLAALADYTILDTPPEAGFDRLTRLAARLFDVPIAFVSLIDQQRQWFKSCVGLDLRELELDKSFCIHTIAADDVCIVPDARLDPRFAPNPFVVGEPQVRFYAAAPLKTSAGYNLGTLGILDTQPRTLTAEEIAMFTDLAAIVVDELELRRATSSAQQVVATMRQEITHRQHAEAGLHAHTRRLSHVIEIQHAIATAHLDLDTIMQLVADQTRALTRDSATIIELVEGDELVYRAASGVAAPFVGLRLKRDASLSGYCARTGEIVRCDHADHDDRVDRAAMLALGIQSMILVPLQYDRTIFGVLKVFSPQPYAFTEQDIETLRLMAGLISAALSHANEFETKQTLLTAQTTALAALRESEDRFRVLFEAAPVGIVIARQARKLYVNPAYVQMFGYDCAAEMAHMPIEAVVAPEWRATILDCHRRREAGEDVPTAYEVIGRRQDGTTFPVYTKVAQIQLTDGPATIAFVMDVTELKRTEAALRETERNLRLMAEYSPAAMYVYDMQRRLVYVNPAVEVLTGYTSAEIMERQFIPWVHPEDEPRMAQRREALFTSHEYFDEEFRIITKDGQVKWCCGTWGPLRDDRGQQIGVQGRDYDITERKLAEAALHEMERKLATLMSNLPGMAYRCRSDAQWTIEFVSDGVRELTGYAPEALVLNRAISFEDLIDPADRAKVREVIEAAVLAQQPYQISYRIHTANGERKWVWEQGRGVLSPEGEAVTLEGFIIDITERRKAEELLRASESKLRLITSQMPVVLWTVDADLRLTSALGAGLNDLGIAPEAVVGRTLFELFRAEDTHVASIAAHHRALAGNAGSHEWVFQGRTFNVRIEPLKNEQREIIGCISIACDITERKQIDEIRARLASIVEASHEAIISATPDGTITSWNGGAEHIYGYAAHEIVGQSAEVLFPPDVVDELPHILELVRQGERVGPYETIRVRKDNTRIDVSITVSAIKDGCGQVIGAASIARDITQQKQAETALGASEERFRQIAESIREMFWIIDLEQAEMIYASPAYRDIWGYELPATPVPVDVLMTIIDQADRPLVQAALKRAAQVPCEQEYRVIWPDGTVRWVRSRGFPLRDRHGQVYRIAGVTEDITERKRAEEEVQRLNADLEHRVRERTAQLAATNRELEAFSYSVSHDLRAPLRAIDGFSQALLEDYHHALDPTGQLYLQRVRAAAQRMAHLIDALLSLARISRTDLAHDTVDLSALARAILHDLQHSQPQRQVSYTVAPDLLAKGDARLLQVVLSNLLGNAWKFTSQQAQAHIRVGQRHERGQVIYFVQDNGAGFDMTYAGKLFGAFQRLHGRTEFEGTGIGLATVQRIIHRHGGRVWAESQVDRGATFYFTLGTMDEA